MSVLRVYLNLRRRSARFATILMVLAAGAAVGQAQTPPYGEFQYATLTGSGNTITATMLPVVTSTGISYFNVVVEFDVAANGTLTVAPGYPTVAKAPRPLIGNFLAGSYVGPATDSSYDITVAGPGVTTAGATEWSLATATGASCSTTPTSATWYVFGGAMKSHPLYTRLKAAGITTATYQAYAGWGTTGAQCTSSNGWETDVLIGVSQIGNTLMITSFSNNNGDVNQPVSQITYTYTNPQP